MEFIRTKALLQQFLQLCSVVMKPALLALETVRRAVRRNRYEITVSRGDDVRRLGSPQKRQR